MATDPRDYKVELSAAVQGAAPAPEPASSASERPFLSVLFACCGVYQRIYRDLNGTTYNGRCPKCGKPVRFAVGTGGTNERFFVVR